MNEDGPSNKIVVIDGDPDMQDDLGYELRMRGYQPIAMRRGEGAFDLVKEEKPHMVIMDVVLPDADGVEVLREIGTHWDTKKTKMIVASTYPSRIDHTVEGLIAAIFRKPLDDWEFLRMLDIVSIEMLTQADR